MMTNLGERSGAGALCAVAVAVLAGCARAEEPRETESERLLPEKVRERARKGFAALEGEVTLVVFTQEFECRSCGENTRLAREVAELSDKVKLKVYDFERDEQMAKQYGIDKIPAIAVQGERDYGIRFYGVPAGYEFQAFLDAIKQVSKGESGLSEASVIALKQVDRPVHIQVFVTPT